MSSFSVDDASAIPCEGWWEQSGFGRQPMHNLRLRFEAGKISGSGSDIIGAFAFAGTIGEGGHVVMVKRYVGQHNVDYLGTYDGEGSMWGEWRIGPFHDRWIIKIRATAKSFSPQLMEAEGAS